jgi:2-polyprenyl-3-methyl-5-hydroxy-6-metoxy-1,4-benzoquinol methylase
MMTLNRLHEHQNQVNYSKDSLTHSALGLDSTLFLAYRDVPQLLQKYLFDNSQNQRFRVLDFGCGAGLSTKLFSKILIDGGYKIEMIGVDISEENIECAKKIVPDATFLKIHPDDSLQYLGHFDLIICNFVLVEIKEELMNKVLNKIESLLSDTGIAIITNCTSSFYKKTNKWYTINNNFPENEPAELKKDKLKYTENQPIKVQVFSGSGSNISFTFFDFFHSGQAYRHAYQLAGLDLLQTHKPIGYDNDAIKWQAEKYFSPYKIHLVTKKKKLLALNKKF